MLVHGGSSNSSDAAPSKAPEAEKPTKALVAEEPTEATEAEDPSPPHVFSACRYPMNYKKHGTRHVVEEGQVVKVNYN